MMEYANTSKTDENAVVLAVKLPTGLTLTPHSTYLANDNSPNGRLLDTDGIVGGLEIGDYSPKANAYLMFSAQTAAIGSYKCGDNVLRTIFTAQPRSQSYFYNTADLNLTRQC